MANPEHLEILKQGVEVWNRWREENPQIQPDLSRVNFEGVHLRFIDLHSALLMRSKFDDAKFEGANLSKTDLRGTTFSEAELIGVKFIEAEISPALFLAADLRDAVFTRANLRKADFSEANLRDAFLVETDLEEANLSEANLGLADLRGASLIGANLSWADFFGVRLQDTNLTRAKLHFTRFVETRLNMVEGLNNVEHLGPSYIDTYTLKYSRGKIPEVFLRGCGLSDVEILMARLHDPDLTSEQITTITSKIHKLLVAKAVHYHSCFISHSSKDEIFARKLRDNLQNKGVRCWFAPEDMKIGDKIRPTIDQSIRVHDKLLLILSGNSLNSFWAESEVEKAFEEERQRGLIVLFPVRLDEAVMETDQPWATEIRRTRHIGDFSRWRNHDSYQQAFERLLRDLKAEG